MTRERRLQQQLRNNNRRQKNCSQLEACDDLCVSSPSTCRNEELHARWEETTPSREPKVELFGDFLTIENVGTEADIAPLARTCYIL